MTLHDHPSETSAWTVTPKHRMRWDCVQDAIEGWQPGRLVEFGAGTGEFSARLADQGFDVVCWDPGEENRIAARARFGTTSGSATVVDDPPSPDGSFDYLAAFEVLEHIADDKGALADWVRRLSPGGRVLVSVPAHMRSWSHDDERVGHVRRYERAELRALLTGAGLTDVVIRCWGFPLGNVTRRLNGAIGRFERRDDLQDADPETRSIISGHRRSATAARSSRLVTDTTMKPFLAAQRRFFDSDRGDGYVATARLA